MIRILLFMAVAFLFMMGTVRADYIIHNRLRDVTDWVDEGNGTQVKVIYDTEGHVDCFLLENSHTWQVGAISCIQK